MKERDHVPVSPTLEALELLLRPLDLDRIVRDVRVERDEETVAVAKRIRRISLQTPRRSLRRNQLRHRGERILQSLRSSTFAASNLVIADREEIRDVCRTCQPFDDRVEADVPHRGVASAQNGVARLQHQTDGERCRRELARPRDDAVDEATVCWLNDSAIARYFRIAA